MKTDPMWIRKQDNRTMNPNELLQYLMPQSRNIILLDGYSGCGKPTILKQLLPAAFCPVLMFSYRDIVDEMLRTECNCDQYLHDLHGKTSIICIEDVDYLSGKDATQANLAQMILIAVRKHTVILTGNSAQQKLPVLCEQCNLEILTASQKGGI